jgi:DNA segregation ATPase FtsK/SpoIIIE, S-DNA-T family
MIRGMPRKGVDFKRGQRERFPFPEDEVVIPPYPQMPHPPRPMPWWMAFAPVGTILVISVAMAFFTKNFIMPLIMVGGSLIFPVVTLARRRRQVKEFEEDKTKIENAYRHRISEVEDELNSRSEEQKRYLISTHPPISRLLEWASGLNQRLWERRAMDGDALEVRLGTGEVRSSFKIQLPRVDLPELAPDLLLETVAMARNYERIEKMPLAYPLKKSVSLAITGPPALREAFARGMLCQIGGLHAPSDVEFFAVYPAKKASDWDWLKWLPHTQALQSLGARPHLAYEPDTIRELLGSLMDELHARDLRREENSRNAETAPFLLLLVTDLELVRAEAAVQRILTDGEELNAGVLFLAPNRREVPEGCAARVDLLDDRRAELIYTARSQVNAFRPDLVTLKTAESLGRQLAPIRLLDHQGLAELPDMVRLLDLVGCSDLETLDLEARWAEAFAHPPELKTPLGMRHGNRVLTADLKQSGAGPHGLIAGTTGSGKSELLLTLLTGLALTHHPHQINFVIVDYKGGTSMSVLEELPHTVGFVTDLDGKQTRRALVALGSEMERREALLARYQVADIEKYHYLRIEEPFPYLFVVIDEFAELKEKFQDDLGEVLKEFVSVAQKGRALGVHLVLAMQKPEGVVNDSIRANMKYRICLRVERAEDSRNVIGRSEAYLLPNRPPGRSYFQVGNNEQFDLFQVARIAGYHQPKGSQQVSRPKLSIDEVGPDGRRVALLKSEAHQEIVDDSYEDVRTEAQIIVEKARQTAARLKIEKLPSPWPPPLSEQLAREELYKEDDPPRWNGQGWEAYDVLANKYSVPVGLLDEPKYQRQRALHLDLVEDGHTLIIGAPGSGRTTFLLSLLAGLAAAMPPDEVHFHLIDFVGHQIRAAFSSFPHTAGVYNESDGERIRRLRSVLDDELERRKKIFADAGVLDLPALNRKRSGKEQLPMILIAINGFSSFRESFPDDLSFWIRLLREGAAYGVVFALTSDRIPVSKVADLISLRIALRMADWSWFGSFLGQRPDLRAYLPVPGRGFFSGKPPIYLQVALPMAGPAGEQISLLQELGESMNSSWTGERPVPLRLLGDHETLAGVLPENVLTSWPINDNLSTWIGLDDENVQPVVLDLERDGPLMIVCGPPESGKTTALLSLAVSLAATHHPEKIQMRFVSPKRGDENVFVPLLGLPHVSDVGHTVTDLQSIVDTMETENGEGGSLAHRVLMIDDYHLLTNRLDQDLLGRLEELARLSSDRNMTVLISLPLVALGGGVDGFVRQFKSGRCGIWLQSTDAFEAQSVGIQMPTAMRKKKLPAGRGYLFNPARQKLIHVAHPQGAGRTESPESLDGWVAAIAGKFQKDGPN